MSQVNYGGNDGYSRPFRYVVPLTAFNITMDQGPDTLVLNPAGTLATGTVVLPTAPPDGSRIRIISSQTQTALTITAGTGDTINNVPTALVALTAINLGYRAADKVWYNV